MDVCMSTDAMDDPGINMDVKILTHLHWLRPVLGIFEFWAFSSQHWTTQMYMYMGVVLRNLACVFGVGLYIVTELHSCLCDNRLVN